ILSWRTVWHSLGAVGVRREEVGPLTVHDTTIVAALSESIARRIGEPRYQLWFEGHTRFSWDDGVLTVGVPNRPFAEWLQQTFVGAVRDAAGEVSGQPMQVRFTIDPELSRAARREQEKTPPKPQRKSAPPTPKQEENEPDAREAEERPATLFDAPAPKRT